MTFVDPLFLLSLLAVPLVAWIYLRLEQRRAGRSAVWSTLALMPNMMPSAPGPRRYLPAALLLLGVTLLLVGFARPEVHVKQVGEGATVVLAVDISGSMAAPDVHPTRLAAADAAITSLLNKLPSKYRAALLTFSDHATVSVPPTYSRDEIIRALPTHAELLGTSLGEAVSAAVQVASKATGSLKPDSEHPTATVVLVSDGGDNSGQVKPAVAAADARRSGVPVSTIAVGTSHGSVSQKLTVGGKSYTEVKQVPIDTTVLRQVADASGGQFYEAGSSQALQHIYDNLQGLPAQGKKPLEITNWVIGAALLLFLASTVLSGVWFRRLL